LRYCLGTYKENNVEREKEMEEDEEQQALLTQAQQQILAEREQRGYHVVVENMMRAEGMAGNLIPASFAVYSAETTCTEQHPGGGQCFWIDFVFHWQDHWHVVLMNDWQQPGISPRQLLADFDQQVEQWREAEERM
jgi:hypothetical protein